MQSPDPVTKARGSRLPAHKTEPQPGRWTDLMGAFYHWLIPVGATETPQIAKKYCRNKQQDQKVSTACAHVKIEGLCE